jgi:hypothetical protein
MAQARSQNWRDCRLRGESQSSELDLDLEIEFRGRRCQDKTVVSIDMCTAIPFRGIRLLVRLVQWADPSRYPLDLAEYRFHVNLRHRRIEARVIAFKGCRSIREREREREYVEQLEKSSSKAHICKPVRINHGSCNAVHFKHGRLASSRR